MSNASRKMNRRKQRQEARRAPAPAQAKSTPQQEVEEGPREVRVFGPLGRSQAQAVRAHLTLAKNELRAIDERRAEIAKLMTEARKIEAEIAQISKVGSDRWAETFDAVLEELGVDEGTRDRVVGAEAVAQAEDREGVVLRVELEPEPEPSAPATNNPTPEPQPCQGCAPALQEATP